MARNDDRRQRLADAGLAVLAREGARGLTHRALDREAGVPTGTASNYFRTRAELVHALADRIGQRLAPDPDTVAGLRSGEAGPAMFADHVRDIVRRLGAEREVTLALF
jgi:AcrR family transcriptional regulator